MRSAVHDILPARVRRSLAKLGKDIGIARRKRRLTIAMMTERMGVAKTTYLRLEKGDAAVAVGVVAMALFVLGLDDALGAIIDPRDDDRGLLMDIDRLPRRIRARKEPRAP